MSGALPLPADGIVPAPAPQARALTPAARAAELDALPDGRLLDLARAGDRAAFGSLIERHHRTLASMIRQRLGRGAPVEDLLQDVFARTLAHLPRFQRRSSFVTWAGAIALNLATDWQRKQARRRRLAPVADVETDAVPAPGLGARDVEQRDEAERARRALDTLPQNMRLAVTLRVVQDLPYDLVAARLGTSVPTARTWVCRGLKRLRKKLEVSHDDA